jgi:quinol monooxygenase YgiN
MIIRVFRARIREGRVPEFKAMVREQSIPWLERTNGMLGYFAGAPLEDNSREFVMVTLWRDTDALKSFVGEHWQTPVVTEDETPLVEEMFAHHYTRFDKEVPLAQ